MCWAEPALPPPRPFVMGQATWHACSGRRAPGARAVAEHLRQPQRRAGDTVRDTQVEESQGRGREGPRAAWDLEDGGHSHRPSGYRWARVTSGSRCWQCDLMVRKQSWPGGGRPKTALLRGPSPTSGGAPAGACLAPRVLTWRPVLVPPPSRAPQHSLLPASGPRRSLVRLLLLSGHVVTPPSDATPWGPFSMEQVVNE